MKTLRYSHPNLLARLHDELLAAGITPERVEGRGEDIWITVADGANEQTIAVVVAAHDPTPDPVPDFGNDATTRDQLVSGVTQLRAYLALANPTAAQSATALKLVIRGFLFLLKEQSVR